MSLFIYNCHLHYLKSNNYFEIDGLKTSWKRVKKQAVRCVSINFPCKGSKWNPQVDYILVLKPVETPCGVSPRWNYRVDCFQVWKLVETTQGFLRNGNYGETTDVTFPCGFQQVSIFRKPLFSPSVKFLSLHNQTAC